ncbi:MAG TPA: ABC transporter permease [Cytophagaceae bacterium]|jgi:lipopolysaccharide transport system permease protein
MINAEHEKWDLQIKPATGWLDINFKEIWRYRDLVALLVKRDWESMFKQTILGPFWAVGQPLLMAVIFTFVFGKMVNISTEGVSPHIFYLCGLLPWNLFSLSFTKISNTLTSNASIFGKVYFPRLVVPLSYLISGLISFTINLGVFLVFVVISILSGHSYQINSFILLVPFLLILLLLFSLGLGLILAALTIKYKDLAFLSTFGLQLFMYATPIIYPLSSVSGEYRMLLEMNPLSSIVEGFRYAILGVGNISLGNLLYSTCIIVGLFTIGLLIFNKSEKSFIDTV